MLARGYALVWDRRTGGDLGRWVIDGQALALEFADGKADATGGRGLRPKPAVKPQVPAEDQGALF